ncbi:MAG: invasion associated locus B family protein [Alkalilacustris sp.]
MTRAGLTAGGAAIAAAGLLAATTVVAAQDESTNRVAAETDWSVFVEESPRACWSVSSPREWVATRDGNEVQVRRGDILFFVTYRPGDNVTGELSYTGGYPFRPDSTVSVEIGNETFQLFTSGDWAWPANPEDDARLMAAMQAGAEAIVTAVSSRGTTTRDTFSLFGFTAAAAEAERRCQ